MPDALVKENDSKANSSASDLNRWDAAHSWHPFTQMQEYASFPQVHVERGEGCWLYDTEGNRYLDGNASVWTNVHGHNDPDLNEALRKQASLIAHSTYLGLSHPIGAELGLKLVEISPEGLDRVVFSDNGSNAIEIALKQSFQFWQLTGKPEKRLVVGMSGGYHGDTFGTMSVGDSGGFHARFANWQFESRTFPAPVEGEDGSAESSLVELEEIFAKEAFAIASVILEPWVQGAAGMRVQPRWFLKNVEALCRRYDVHLILDEVFVAFGRMGAFFVCEQEDVQPDFLCLAKGISAGYLPLAATLTRQSIYEAFLGDFDSGRGFYHGHTFTGNPLAAAVSMRSIQKLEVLFQSGELTRRISFFEATLKSRFAGHANVLQLRQRGLAAAIDLYAGEGQPDWNLNDRTGMKVCLAARKHGLLLRPLMDSILIVPPIAISEKEIEFLCDRLAVAIDEAIN